MLHSEQKPKRRYKFRNFEFWASYGKIAILDTENYDPKYNDVDNARYVNPGEFLKRAMAIRAILDESSPMEGKRLLDDALECVKEAKEQGDISNPKILVDKAYDLRNISIYVPATARIGNQNNIIDELRRLKKIAAEKKIDPKSVFTDGYKHHLSE